MWDDFEKDVLVCFDMILLKHYSNAPYENLIKIEIEHDTQTQVHEIEYNSQNVVQSLNIVTLLKLKGPNQEYYSSIKVYINNNELIKEIIDLRTSIVGALKYFGEYTLSLPFRVINQRSDEIVIFNYPRYQRNDFKILKELGSGSYGHIYEGLDSLNRPHALKIMQKRIDINNRNDATIREVLPLITLPNHPCLIKLEGFIYDRDHGIIFVFEFASLGRIDLVDYENVNDDTIYKLYYGLCSCIAFLHDHGFIHRDIHPSNVLLSKNFEIKLIDFGVSRFICEEMTQDVGHCNYKSPDMETSVNYEELVDEYSLGVLLLSVREKMNFDPRKYFYFTKLFFPIDERVTCSELCLMIENKIFWKKSFKNNEYYNELSQFHKSKPIRDTTIKENYEIFSKLPPFHNKCFDMAKLATNVGIEDSYSFYRDLILYHDGIALDTEYFDPRESISHEKMSESFFDKCDLYCQCFLYNLNEYSGETAEEFSFFTNVYSKKCSQIMGVEAFFKTDANVDVIDKLIKIALVIDRPEPLNLYLGVLKKMDKFDEDTLFQLNYAASFGIIKAFEILAYYYLDKSRDLPKVFHYANIAYRNGRFRTATMIGKYYLIKKEYQKAREYFMIGAKYGCSKALFRVGANDINGSNVDGGLLYLRKSANKGFSEAQKYLAEMNFYGYKVPINFEQSYYYNYIALTQGNNHALYLKGIFNFFGIVVKQDYREAKRIFKQIFKSPLMWRRQYSRTLLFLSEIYLLGLGVNVDIIYGNRLFSQYIVKLIENGKIKDKTGYKDAKIDNFHHIKNYSEANDNYIMIDDNDQITISREALISSSISQLFDYEMKNGRKFLIKNNMHFLH